MEKFSRYIFPDGLEWQAHRREDGVVVMHSFVEKRQSIQDILDSIGIESSRELRRIRSRQPVLWWGETGVTISGGRTKRTHRKIIA